MGGDIAYIPTGEGWLYFAAVKDLCTRKIVGYAFSHRINAELTLAALNTAIGRERPAEGLLFHADRGAQCTARATPMTTLWRRIFSAASSAELVHLQRYETRSAAEAAIFAYVEAFYNTVRPPILRWVGCHRPPSSAISAPRPQRNREIMSKAMIHSVL